MTPEEVNRFEVDAAREAGVTNDVIEMLTDKDRYVWQLIDELEFF